MDNAYYEHLVRFLTNLVRVILGHLARYLTSLVTNVYVGDIFKKMRCLGVILLLIFISGCMKSNTDETILQDMQAGVPTNRIPRRKSYIGVVDPDLDEEDTVLYKTYYDEPFRDYPLYGIFYPEINLRENMQDYFEGLSKATIDGDKQLCGLFFDNRSVSTDEETLKKLFYENGYEINFHTLTFADLYVRFIEWKECDSLSLYPSRTLLQTWDDKNIYLQEIAAPYPRKIRSIMPVVKEDALYMVVHSTGVSENYISEEELAFWRFAETHWKLSPLELEIDASALGIGAVETGKEKSEWFSPVYYRDGIVYQPEMMGEGIRNGYLTYPCRLGIMQEVEENCSFKLIPITDIGGKTVKCEYQGYIQFEIQ